MATPMILATGGVHAHLVEKGLRSYCSIITRSAECLDTQYFAAVSYTHLDVYKRQDKISVETQNYLANREKLIEAYSCLLYTSRCV